MESILKVYPAKFWHDEVVIIGNESGLHKLKTIIENALKGVPDSAYVKETDGKSYNISCKMHTGDIINDKLPLHYEEEDIDITDEEREFLSKFLLESK
jgi:hypothetical protein